VTDEALPVVCALDIVSARLGVLFIRDRPIYLLSLHFLYLIYLLFLFRLVTPRPRKGKAINVTELHHHWTQRIDDFLSGGPGSACRPSRCLVWRRGHRGRSVSHGSRAGARWPCVLVCCSGTAPIRERPQRCLLSLYPVPSGVSPSVMFPRLRPCRRAGYLRCGKDQMNHRCCYSQDRFLEAVAPLRLWSGCGPWFFENVEGSMRSS
jgi:hypothetical protein